MEQNIFVTGGTGLVGSFLIPRILRSSPASRITLLVRAASDAELEGRTARLIAWLTADGIPPEAAARLRCVRGDVLDDGLGLGPNELRRLLRETTHIIHGAAAIRFNLPLEEARTVNTGGTRRMLQIAEEAASHGSLQRLLYVGSSSVSGRRSGAIYEHELEMGQEFFNTYEQSKCESERLVRGRMDAIPTTIVRPSIIIGDSRTGRTTTFNVIYIPLRFFYRGVLDSLPVPARTPMDLVPVDWVADVMTYLLWKEDARGAVCHLTAGPDRAVPIEEITRLAGDYFERRTPREHPRRIEFVDEKEFVRRFERWGSRGRRILEQLDSLLPYATVDRLFDTTVTCRLLEGSGIAFPRFRDYAEKIFAYCIDTDWGRNLS